MDGVEVKIFRRVQGWAQRKPGKLCKGFSRAGQGLFGVHNWLGVITSEFTRDCPENLESLVSAGEINMCKSKYDEQFTQ
jgi:hypothetical protein